VSIECTLGAYFSRAMLKLTQ